MIKRRRFLKMAAAMPTALMLGACRGGSANASDTTSWRMPDEADPHLRTWMAFGASEEIWGETLLPETRNSLALLARTIARYEPVIMLARAEEMDLARDMVGPDVELIASPLDDLWMRDTGPVFVVDDAGKKGGVHFNFNGWGEKQAFSQDKNVAAFITGRAGVTPITTSLVLEGGAIEVDGKGTAIVAESCVLNSNRNPLVSRAAVEDELSALLGLDKIIWIPGIKDKDITDGHTDFYARFARPGVVLVGYDPDPNSFDHEVTLSHLEILRAAKDASGNALEVLTLEAPTDIRETSQSEDFAAGYIGFYVCNGAVIMQEFGDAAADQAAKQTIAVAFPDRAIEQINIDGIAAGGGSIHCATQQEPKA